MNNTDLEYYLSLPYKIILYPAEEGGFEVEIPDLPGPKAKPRGGPDDDC